MRHVIAALLVSVIASAVLHAETLVIPVVGQGWRIKFEGPVLAVESQHFDADGLIYRGNAGRFNVSAIVEPQPGGGDDSKACRDHFWQKAVQNPMVQKDSVKQWSTPMCECVEYVTVDESQGEKQTLANIDCYFELLGKWVDIHASVITPTDDDTRMLKKLGESLIYCTFARPKSEPQEFEMGAMGRLRFVVPAAWQLGNHCVTMGIGTAEQHSLALFSPTDPNKTWKMTFFNSSMRYKTQKDIEVTAQNVQQAAAAHSVEGAAKMQEIKLKQGVGCQAVFTDAALAEKPVEPGNAKVTCSGLVAPQPDVLGTVTISADDAKDADFLAAIQALESIEWITSKAPEGKE
ncbi:hypothetical protein [Prosthecobacter sp.]|uniref:hypothetical protein n=1 Tax=Prosthecobacter sp. TaxID=1965333 RepID=UPI00378358C8